MNPVRLLSLFLAAFAPALSAQSSVWKAEREGATVYLGGTCHILRSSDFPLPSEFDAAYSVAESLVFEADPAELQSPEFATQLMARARYDDGRTLRSELSPEAYAALEAHCAESGFPIAILNGLKPGMAAMMLALHELQKAGVSQEGVDFFYHKKAVADGKPISGLETAEFQLELITSMGDGMESELMLYSLQDLDQIEAYFDGLIRAWRRGDLDRLDSLFVEDLATYPDLYQRLLADRNTRWLPRIEALFESPETEFVLVGVGHLVGEDGLLHLLEERGYEVTQVSAPAP